MTEVGLSWKTAQPEYYKSDERPQEAFQESLSKKHRQGNQIRQALSSHDVDLI